MLYDETKCRWVYDNLIENEEFSAVMSGAVSGTRYFRIAASNKREGVFDLDGLEAQINERVARGPLAGWYEKARREEAERQGRIGLALARIRGGFKAAS
jgi:hypothetical protein